MNHEKQSGSGRSWTAAELRKVPRKQRNQILAAQAALAEAEYRSDPDLTAFDAFGPDDLHGESSSTKTRRRVAG
jgi:hypothetical protein